MVTMELKYFLACVIRPILINKKLTVAIVATLLVIKLFTALLLSRNSTHSPIDTAFLNLNAENIELNTDLKVPTQTYIIDYNRIQQKWLRMKERPDRLKYRKNSNRRLFVNDSTSNDYLILEYTKIGGHPRFCENFDNLDTSDNLNSILGEDESIKNKIFVEQCPYKNCRFTCQKTRINEAHVLLFHESDLKQEIEKEDAYFDKLSRVVRDRSAQIWVLWNDEANTVSSKLDQFKFNWTMTYRIDSEVSDCSYGCTYSKTSNEAESNSKFLAQTQLDFGFRSNSAVWFVSNCDARLRLKFASTLKSIFPVTVHGKCAKFVHGSNNFIFNYLNNFISDSCDRYSVCEKEEFARHKFYLSFESKNCSSYITEKLWRILSTNMIPVVLQPSREFYEKIAPPNSFIHAQDFGYDAKKLAAYLRNVGNDLSLYRKHLAWKKRENVVYSQIQCEKRRMCELCTRLNKETAEIYYKSVSQWFNGECIVN